MGLDCSHDAFHGAYSAFNRLRQKVTAAFGGSYPPHEDESLDPRSWYIDKRFIGTRPGLYAFLTHSDCDGEMDPETCRLVARDLTEAIGLLQPDDLGSGHIASQGGYAEVLGRFIAGCQRAADAGEPLLFE